MCDWIGFQFADEKLWTFTIEWTVLAYWAAVWLNLNSSCWVVDSLVCPDGKGLLHTAAYSDQEIFF